MQNEIHDIPEDDRISQNEAAKIIGCSRQTVANDLKRGYLTKSFRTRNNRWFSRAEVVAWSKHCFNAYNQAGKLPDAK